MTGKLQHSRLTWWIESDAYSISAWWGLFAKRRARRWARRHGVKLSDSGCQPSKDPSPSPPASVIR